MRMNVAKCGEMWRNVAIFAGFVGFVGLLGSAPFFDRTPKSQFPQGNLGEIGGLG